MMINFKQFLAEARIAPLYHATFISSVDSILNDGFKGNTMQLKYHGRGQATKALYGVSFARDIKSSDWYMKVEQGSIREPYVVFEVDQQKINQRHKLFPVDYFGTQDLMHNHTSRSKSSRKETEEFARVHRKWNDELETFVGNVSPKVITAVHFFRRDLKTLQPLIDQYSNIKWKQRAN